MRAVAESRVSAAAAACSEIDGMDPATGSCRCFDSARDEGSGGWPISSLDRVERVRVIAQQIPPVFDAD